MLFMEPGYWPFKVNGSVTFVGSKPMLLELYVGVSDLRPPFLGRLGCLGFRHPMCGILSLRLSLAGMVFSHLSRIGR